MRTAVVYSVGVSIAIALAWATLQFVNRPELAWPFLVMQGFYMGWVARYFDAVPPKEAA